MWALALVIAIPVIEIALFILVGGAIGVWPTIGLVLLAAFVGVALVRMSGMRTLAGVQDALRRGEDPGEQIFGAAVLMIAAGLFVTPGFLTDTLALLLLVPPVRRMLYRAVLSRMRMRTAAFSNSYGDAQSAQPAGDIVIEGDFEDVTQRKPTHQPSGWTRH